MGLRGLPGLLSRFLGSSSSSSSEEPPLAVRLAATRAAAAGRPYDADLWLKRATLAEEAGEMHETVESLFHVADLYAKAGMRAKAIEPIRYILALDPTHEGARALRRLIPGSIADDVAGTRPDGVSAIPTAPVDTASLDREVARELAAAGFSVELTAGTPVIHEGDQGNSIYVVERGELRIEVFDPTLGSRVKLATLGPGAIIGELAFLTGGRRTATVVAETDAVLVEVRADELRERIAADPRIVDVLVRQGRSRLLSVIGAALVTSPPFSSLSPPRRSALVRKMRLMRVAADDVVVREGEPLAGLLFVALGHLEAMAGGRIAGHHERGDVLDVPALLDGHPASATVRALEPACLLVLARADLDDLLADVPRFRDALADLTPPDL